MEFEPKTEEEQAQAISRLVDDSLSASERPAVEAWASQRPEIRRQVAAQRKVAGTLSSSGPEAPERLLAAVRTRMGASDEPNTQRGLRGWLGAGPAWRPVAGGVALAAVCALVVIAIVGVGGPGSGPSIPAAANLAFAPSTQPAPAARSSRLLDVSYAGVTYPNYAEFAVPPIGTRTDRIGGRPALTVFYRLPNGTRLSYTVFSGAPVRLPRAAKAVTFEGVPLRTFRTSNGLAVVTLVRFGRTCVLAARTTQDRVLALAAAPVRAQTV